MHQERKMSTIQLTTTPAARRHGASRRARRPSFWARGVQRAVDLLLTWQHRARDRQQLQSLSDHMLRDIGLTRADVFAEASKPFWRP
jgi:uncharacterized protein YjiS (DUF1127 family)